MSWTIEHVSHHVPWTYKPVCEVSTTPGNIVLIFSHQREISRLKHALTDLKTWSFRVRWYQVNEPLNMIHYTCPEILNSNTTFLRHLEMFSDSNVNCRTSQVRQNTFDVSVDERSPTFSECLSDIMTMIFHYIADFIPCSRHSFKMSWFIKLQRNKKYVKVCQIK